VQGYSCTESVYWIGKAFLCLALEDDDDFWTAKENNGIWQDYDNVKIIEENKSLKNYNNSRDVNNDVTEYGIKESADKFWKYDKNKADNNALKHNIKGNYDIESAGKLTYLKGPGILCINHLRSGITEIETSKVLKNKADIRGMYAYGKLSYNSKFPWEAAFDDNIEAMQYLIKDDKYPTTISKTLTKMSHEDFTDEEIFPIKNILFTDKENMGGYGSVEVEFMSGKRYVVDYKNII